MRKLLVSMVAVAILAFGTVSASAVVSPSVDGDDNTPDATTPTSSSSNSNSNSNSSNTTTSPKTGVSGTYAIFAALSVLACGGVATVAKRKLSK